MSTFIFYIFILIFSTFFVYISDKGKGKLEKNVFLFIAFLTTFLPAALRYDVGTDYINYLYIYNNLDYYGFTDGRRYIEPAYYLMNKMLASIDASAQMVFVISAFLFSCVSFRAYPKKGAWLIHLLMMLILWFYSLNIVRQSIAVAFCFAGVFKYIEKDYKRFAILTFIGSMFHVSVLIIPFIGLAALIPIRQSLKTRVFPAILIGLITISYISINLLLNYIEQFLNIINFTKFLNYFGGKYFIEAETGTGIGTLIKIIVSSYFITQTKTLLRINQQYWMIILLNTAYAISTILSQEIIIFGRLQIALSIAPIFTVYILFNISSNRKIHRIFALVIILVGILGFVNKSLPSNNEVAKLNPYRTVFSK